MFYAHNFAGFFGAVPAHNIVAKQTDDWFQFLDSHKDRGSAPAGILWPKRMLLFWSPPPITHTFSDQGGNGPRNHTYWQFGFCFYKTIKFIFSNKQNTTCCIKDITSCKRMLFVQRADESRVYQHWRRLWTQIQTTISTVIRDELLYLHVHIMCSCSRGDIPILPIVEIVETQTWELGWAALQVCPLVSTITLTNTPPPPDGSPINTEEKLACVNKDCFL